MTSDDPECCSERAEPSKRQADSPARDPLSDSDIADLLDEYHHALARLETDVATIADSQSDVLADIADLRASSGGSGGPAKAAVTPSRWSWRHANDTAARELEEELTEFVTWLTGRYLTDSPHRIPDCWNQHPVAVEELTALMAAWQAAYCNGDQPTDRLTAWHTHHLWPVLRRFPEVTGLRQCDRMHSGP